MTGAGAIPAVSIVLPTWNVAHLLRDAVASVLAQTYTDWELIVVDDGSTDDTISFLEHLDDTRIAVIPSAHTGRPGLLRNRGVARAQADIIAFLDSDDLWEPDKLEVQLPALRAEETFDWSYTNTLVIDERGRDITSTVTPWEPHSGMILDQLLRLEARVSLSTVMIRRRVFADAGGFDPDSGVEDYDLWTRIAPRHAAVAIPRPLTRTRWRPDSYQSDRVMAHRAWQQIYRKAAAGGVAAGTKRFCEVSVHRHRLSEASYLARTGRRAAAVRVLFRAILPGLRYRAGLKTFLATARSIITP